MQTLGDGFRGPLEDVRRQSPTLDFMPMRQHPWILEMKEKYARSGLFSFLFHFFNVLDSEFFQKRARCVRKHGSYKEANMSQKFLYLVPLLWGKQVILSHHGIQNAH